MPDLIANLPILGCVYEGRPRTEGETFFHPYDPCKKCQCSEGGVLCTPVPCDTASCSTPLQKLCCDECLRCYLGDRTYDNNEQFYYPDDLCKICECHDGAIHCSAVYCSDAVRCTHPVTIHRHCCPVCDQGCFHQVSVFTLSS